MGGKNASKKTELKQKQKVIEDKTFGLKNKNKSAKVNRYVQEVQKQVMTGGTKTKRREEDEKLERQKLKLEQEKMKIEMAQLFKPVVVQQKVSIGTDPKSVVCAFFKQGLCTKGDKCKFSHDLNVERKAAKIDLYTDARAEKEQDTMDKWDYDKLQQVVTQKHGPGIKTTTDIVCKFFLEAIEQKKYGWFWVCPNGGDKCKYRHALPPGFVLKKDKAADSEKVEISLEEFLETERHSLGNNLTPVTLETFTEWKRKRKARQEEEAFKKQKEREEQFKAGKLMASGRELFVYQPDLFKDDEHATEDVDYTQIDVQEEQVVPIEESLFETDLEALNVDDDE